MREAIHKLHDTNEELQDLNKLLALNYSDEIVRQILLFELRFKREIILLFSTEKYGFESRGREKIHRIAEKRVE